MYEDNEREFKFGRSSNLGGEQEDSAHYGENNIFLHKKAGGSGLRDDEAIRNMEHLEIQQRHGLNHLQEQMDSSLLPSEKRDKMRYGGNYLHVNDHS